MIIICDRQNAHQHYLQIVVVIIIIIIKFIGIIFAVVIINTFILIVISQTISLIVPIHFVEEASNHQQWSLQLAAKGKGRVVGQSLN